MQEFFLSVIADRHTDIAYMLFDDKDEALQYTRREFLNALAHKEGFFEVDALAENEIAHYRYTYEHDWASVVSVQLTETGK